MQTTASYNVFSVVLVFSMLGLGRILISDLVVANLLMYSLPGMILLYLAAPFLHQRCFGWDSLKPKYCPSRSGCFSRIAHTTQDGITWHVAIDSIGGMLPSDNFEVYTQDHHQMYLTDVQWQQTVHLFATLASQRSQSLWWKGAFCSKSFH